MHLYLKMHLVFENKCMHLFSKIKQILNFFKFFKIVIIWFIPIQTKLTLVITECYFDVNLRDWLQTIGVDTTWPVISYLNCPCFSAITPFTIPLTHCTVGAYLYLNIWNSWSIKYQCGTQPFDPESEWEMENRYIIQTEIENICNI